MNMPSQQYRDLVVQGRQFHKNNKTSRGTDVKKYRKQIITLVEYYGARTMLDYGCGKGEQYTVPRNWNYNLSELSTFDQYLGLESYIGFDPWVEGRDQLPLRDAEFDCIICTQAMGNFPEEDFAWILDNWQRWAKKFVFIGEYNPNIPVKSRKNLSDFSERSIEWYLEKFKDWTGCPVYWYWKGRPELEINAWFDQELLSSGYTSNVME